MSKLISKSLLTGLLLLMSASVFADQTYPNYFNGLYLGAHAGLGEAIFQQEGSASNQTNFPFAVHQHGVSKNGDATSLLGLGGIQIGYGSHFNNFYLGAELFADFNDASAETKGKYGSNFQFNPPNSPAISANRSYSVNISSRLNNTYGFSLKPGYLLTPDTLLFAEVGVVQGNVKLSTTANLQDTAGSESSSITANESDRKTLTGYRLGLGVEKYVTRNLTVLASYAFSDYGSFSVDAKKEGLLFGDTPTTVSSTATTSLKTHAIQIGLNYRFS